MSKRRINRRQKPEKDSVYILKIILYHVIGIQWLRITLHSGMIIPIPIGFLIGLLFTSHEHFQIDRKIEYAVLLTAMVIGFWLPVGVSVLL